METRYHIGLLTGTLLILAILSYAYYADYNYRKEIARTEQTSSRKQNRQSALRVAHTKKRCII